MSKIFGIGAHRTGTLSLATALRRLGILTSHWQHHEELTKAYLTGDYELSFLTEYEAVVDLPVPIMFRELDQHYPGSKFILTDRAVESWLRSVERYLNGRRLVYEEYLLHGAWQYDASLSRVRFEQHRDDVITYFESRPEDLLILSVVEGEGYEKLCPYLGLEPPNEPFPDVNKGQDQRYAVT